VCSSLAILLPSMQLAVIRAEVTMSRMQESTTVERVKSKIFRLGAGVPSCKDSSFPRSLAASEATACLPRSVFSTVAALCHGRDSLN